MTKEKKIGSEKLSLDVSMILCDYPSPNTTNINATKYKIESTEEEIVNKLTRNLLAHIAKHRESKFGVDMNIELGRLINKYKV